MRVRASRQKVAPAGDGVRFPPRFLIVEARAKPASFGFGARDSRPAGSARLVPVTGVPLPPADRTRLLGDDGDECVEIEIGQVLLAHGV